MCNELRELRIYLLVTAAIAAMIKIVMTLDETGLLKAMTRWGFDHVWS